ncbi:hypothetical protein SAMN02745911_1160 [Aureimonas altamirensis DSM 21988]|uniref:Uncharacterized protein n=1 Tax=Aureimonas altamirensis DSM 21988 TaxID=1121026 RepID=A0ABY1I8W4_9HYPH|nr:hypothetical protein SAMN02745911_1160 [Aureimonas altamirensis DSM 21988]
MSARDLGQRIDELAFRGAFIREGEHSVNISNLAASDARELANLCRSDDMSCSISDEAGTRWGVDDLEEALEPFRIIITKSSTDSLILQVLTEQGFRDLLIDSAVTKRVWWIAGLGAPIRTFERVYLPWGRIAQPFDEIETKNPRYLVREYTEDRIVPSNVGRWILRNPDMDLGVSDRYRNAWAEAATMALASSLPNEIDAESGALRFRGPPRLILEKPSTEDLSVFAAGQGFDELQKAANWVFESERETETRHLLLASEIARSATATRSATAFLLDELKTAVEGARIAYEMHLSSMGAETIKSLAELRKAVTEETGKVTEATRQTSAAVASALAVGLGLLAAKVTTAVSSILTAGLMAVAVVYVLMVIVTGWVFVSLQREARAKWKERLYRFIPGDDYKELVTDPTERSELAFKIACILGGGSVIALAIVVVFLISVPASVPLPRQ